MQERTNQTVHDPVCHMDILIEEAAGSSDHNGLTYYFCAVGCKMDFDEDPEGVLEAEGQYDHSQPMDHGMGGSDEEPVTHSTEGAPVPGAPLVGSGASSGGSMSHEEGDKKPWWQFWK